MKIPKLPANLKDLFKIIGIAKPESRILIHEVPV